MRVLFQGDSITDCGRRNCGGAGFDSKGLGPGYPGMIAGRLMCDYPQTEWDFINLGIGGNRIVDLYARWKSDCINLKPDIVSIFIGVNDTWHQIADSNGVEVARYARFYRELLEWTRQELPQVSFVLMDPFVCPALPEREQFAAELAERRKIVAEMAAEFDAVHIEVQALFDNAFQRAPQEYWAADGIHPTLPGHQLIADAWIEKTAKILFRNCH